MNDWNRIRQHYANHAEMIMSGPACDWAIDAYAWDNGMIRRTPIEELLWSDIRQANAVMYPQFPVAGVFVDFGNPVAKVAIECDGKAYHLDKEKDRARDDMLARIGWTVYRLTGSECNTDSDPETGAPGLAARIVRAIANEHRICRSYRRTNEPLNTGCFSRAAHA